MTPPRPAAVSIGPAVRTIVGGDDVWLLGAEVWGPDVALRLSGPVVPLRRALADLQLQTADGQELMLDGRGMHGTPHADAVVRARRPSDGPDAALSALVVTVAGRAHAVPLGARPAETTEVIASGASATGPQVLPATDLVWTDGVCAWYLAGVDVWGWRVAIRLTRTPGGHDVATPLVGLRDDVRTAYRWSGSGSSGNSRRSHETVELTPAPPGSARMLLLEVGGQLVTIPLPRPPDGGGRG